MTKPLESTTRFLAESTAQAALTGVWTASAEFPTAKRRTVRAGVLGTAALIAAATRDRSAAGATGIATPAPAVPGGGTPETPTVASAGQAAAVAAGVGLSVAVYLGGRRLENRWLARLARNGHAHPHRALAVRMAALSLLTSLATRLLGAQAASRWATRHPDVRDPDGAARGGDGA